MNNIIIYSLIIIIGLILINQVNLLERFFGTKEYFDSIMKDTHMTHNSLKYFKAPMFPDVLEISKLRKCSYAMRYFYGKNINYIWTNGKYINIPILRQITRNYLIYQDKKYKLTDIRLEPSVLTMNNKPYLLQVRFLHTNPIATCDLHIIIPLNLTKNKNIKELEFIPKEDIPQYRGGTRDFSKVVNIQLKDIGSLLEKQHFYKYDLLENYNWLITDPMNINSTIGLKILASLKVKHDQKIKNTNTNFLESDYDFY